MADAEGARGGVADAIARLRLIRTPRIGPVSYRQLVLRFGSAEGALAAIPDLARRGGGDAPRVPAASLAMAEIEAVARAGARHVFMGKAEYPALLAEIESAPPVLIVAGDIELAAQRSVAMVGARNASAAAIRFARQLGHQLAEAGLAVVSGLARGIDTASHVGALGAEGAGGTVAVIAGGIDIVYPPENDKLQRAIAERGLLVAEMPPGTEPRARHFPYRNRIIAGMSQATLVVEAVPKSGSLITARYAGEYGRDVLAVPGSPLDPRAQGCNLLIRDGATLIQTVDDVLEALGPIDARLVRSPVAGFAAAAVPVDAGERERRVIVDLLGPSALPVDELIRLTGLPSAIVQTVLLELELGGRLERHAGGRVSTV